MRIYGQKESCLGGENERGLAQAVTTSWRVVVAGEEV